MPVFPTAASSRPRRRRQSATSSAWPRRIRQRGARSGGGGGATGGCASCTMPLVSDADVAPVTLSDADGVAHLSPLAHAGAGDRRRGAVSRRGGLHRALGADAGRVLLPRPRARRIQPHRARGHRRAHARHRRRRRADPQDESAGRASRGDLRGARRDRQGAVAGASSAGQLSCCTSCAGGRTTSRATCCRPPGACAGSRCIRWAPASCCSIRTRPSPASWRALSRTRSCSRRLPRPAPGSTRLGIRGTGALNDAITQGRLPEVSLVAEALHEAHISRIAADIVARGEADAGGAGRRAVVVRQDDVFQASGGAVAGQRPPPVSRGAGRLLPGPRAHAA